MKIIALLMLTVGLVSANPLKSVEDTKTIADSILQKVGVSEFKAAFNLAKPYWPVGHDEIDRLAEKTRAQLTGIESRYGKVIGVEYIGSTTLGESYRQYAYVVKLEKHLLKWSISFYKPKDVWKINLLSWNDKPQELLPQFGKVEKVKK